MKLRATKSFAMKGMTINVGDEFEVDDMQGKRMIHRRHAELIVVKKKRGRPKGSKNKPKERAAEPPPVEAAAEPRDIEVIPDPPVEMTDAES